MTAGSDEFLVLAPRPSNYADSRKKERKRKEKMRREKEKQNQIAPHTVKSLRENSSEQLNENSMMVKYMDCLWCSEILFLKLPA